MGRSRLRPYNDLRSPKRIPERRYQRGKEEACGDRIVPAWWTGFARGRRAVSAEPIPGSRHHSARATRFVAALVERIGSVLRQFADSSRIHLVFSAHGLPMSLVEKGDPYPKQIEATVRAVCELGAKEHTAWPKTHLLCYQSRVGPAKWLQPALTETIERLGRGGVKEMLVVPISFVTEHIETLHEINIEAREDAEKVGIETFRMMPAVGDSPLFIAALKDLGLRAVGVQTGSSSARLASAQMGSGAV